MKTDILIIIISILITVVCFTIPLLLIKIPIRSNSLTDEQLSDINKQIDDIIKERYNNYKGAHFHELRQIHGDIRRIGGDYSFLQFLKKQDIENPKPLYQIPPEFYNENK